MDSESLTYCPKTGSLLTPVTDGSKLRFKSEKIGTMYDATPESTLLLEESAEEVGGIGKFRNTLLVTAYNPTNPRMLAECHNCGRKVVSYQRLGPQKKTVLVCLCGMRWGLL